MTLAPGEPTQFDEVYVISGHVFCVSKDILARAQAFTISVYPEGHLFITPKIPLR